MRALGFKVGLGAWKAAALALLLVSAGGCQAAKKENPRSIAPARQVPLAAETFDKVWQIINDYHFDTNFAGVNWEAMREKYRPRAVNAPSTQAFHDTIQEMLDLLKVSHLAIIPGDLAEIIEEEPAEDSSAAMDEGDAGPGNPGLTVRLWENNAIVTAVWENSPAAEAGVKPGWIVTKVKNVALEPRLKKLRRQAGKQLLPFLAWKMANGLISGAPGTEVQLEFRDGRNKPIALTLERERLPGTPVQMGSLPELYADLSSSALHPAPGVKIGVIRFNIWLLPAALAFDKALNEFRDADGIILDLRGNIGGVAGMVMGVAGHFLNEPVVLGTLKMRDNQMRFPANPRRVNAAGQRVEPFTGPVAILLDEISVSASELFAGSMQELGRARLFGRRTSGQALPAIHDKLPNGDVLYHPFADFVTAKGNRIEARGVIPDVEIPLNRGALLAGRDTVLDAAVNWILAQKRNK